jgi:hypothetical protein
MVFYIQDVKIWKSCSRFGAGAISNESEPQFNSFDRRGRGEDAEVANEDWSLATQSTEAAENQDPSLSGQHGNLARLTPGTDAVH